MIPKLNSTEWDLEIKFYQGANREEIDKRAKSLSIQPQSYERRMRERGISKVTETVPTSPEKEEVVVNLPLVKLREFKGRRVKKGDEEEAILHASDGHACKITISYDVDVYNERMDKLFDSAMAIITLHRNMYPIKKLRIFNTGDNMQGESYFQGSNIGNVTMGARDQTIKVAYPAWVKLIASLKQEFEEVIFDGVAGNHGYEKLAPETSREDLRLYDLLKVYFERVKGVTINAHETFSTIVDVLGFKCFQFHGDGIPCQQGVPFFALDRKLKAWYMQYGGFDYAFGGHFHKRHSDEISSKLEYFMCGSLASDDEWALKKLGISSSPSQSIYGMHPEHGITWRYKVEV